MELQVNLSRQVPMVTSIIHNTSRYHQLLSTAYEGSGGGKALLGWPLHSPVMFQVTCRFYR